MIEEVQAVGGRFTITTLLDDFNGVLSPSRKRGGSNMDAMDVCNGCLVFGFGIFGFEFHGTKNMHGTSSLVRVSRARVRRDRDGLFCDSFSSPPPY